VAARKLADSDVGPGQIHKWHRCAIGLTPGRLVVVAWPEVDPASGGDEVTAVRLLRLEFRRG
jgi:hypothetical protein